MSILNDISMPRAAVGSNEMLLFLDFLIQQRIDLRIFFSAVHSKLLCFLLVGSKAACSSALMQISGKCGLRIRAIAFSQVYLYLIET